MLIAKDMGRTLRFARGLRAYVLRSESLHHRHARACRAKRMNDDVERRKSTVSSATWCLPTFKLWRPSDGRGGGQKLAGSRSTDRWHPHARIFFLWRQTFEDSNAIKEIKTRVISK